MISDWRALPFREIWCVDTEFYPGAGFANGGVEGDASSPLCLVALELRSGRLVRLWKDELGLFPPYRLDADALMVGYALTAEFGIHIACGWSEPACALDAYVEFRHNSNDGSLKSEDRDKGFYGIGGALQFFLEDGVDLARKHSVRDRILLGPPFTAQERADILSYCEDDVRALARLLRTWFPLFARCRTRRCGQSSSGLWRSRSAAAFRSTVPCSAVSARSGKACRSAW